MKDLKFRLTLIGFIAVAAAFLLFNPFMRNSSGDWSPNLRLGLDLKGGVSLELDLDPTPGLRSRVNADIAQLKKSLQDRGVKTGSIHPNSSMPGQLVVEDIDVGQVEAFTATLEEGYREIYGWEISGTTATMTLRPEVRIEMERTAIDQTRDILANRINRFGVAESKVQRKGGDSHRVVVELPGVSDSKEIRIILKEAANLEWRLVRAPQGGAASKAELMAQFPDGILPSDVEILPGDSERYGGERWFVVETYAPVMGENLSEVRLSSDQYGKPAIAFYLDTVSAERFRDFTKANINQSLGIVLDGVLISNPVIRAELYDQGVIEGMKSRAEVLTLVNNLKSGRLPAEPTIVQERTVGPSLGRDAIQRGLASSLWGTALVILYMLLYYRMAGMNACIALLFNMLILMGVMSLFGLVLTIPGIAGIALTVGMAVDANVLIFERVKEELRAGKTVRTSLGAGFEKAFSAIWDSNLTTLIAALFLIQFATESVKGFAVTLSVGLLASMFTAVFVSRTLFDAVHAWRTERRKEERIAIGPVHFLSGINLPFLRFRFVAMMVSVLSIIVALVVIKTKGFAYGVDFKGGTEMTVRFVQAPDMASVRERVAKVTSEAPTVVAVGDPNLHEFIIKVPGKVGLNMVEEEKTQSHQVEDIQDALRTQEENRLKAEGKLDLNQISSVRLVELLDLDAHAGKLTGSKDQFLAFADALAEKKTKGDGILLSMSELEGLNGMTPALKSYLDEHAYVGSSTVLQVDSVGPSVGVELREKASHAVVWSLLGTLVYLWYRFQFRFSIGAIVATAHDTMIVLGVLALTGVTFDLNVVAAVLTVVGYSLNDTIVVFDRIRENLQRESQKSEMEIMNQSINETLTRTINTGGTTLVVVLCMLFLGGSVLKGFAITLLTGIVVGTFSSIFVATPVVIYWEMLLGHWNRMRNPRNVTPKLPK